MRYPPFYHYIIQGLIWIGIIVIGWSFIFFCAGCTISLIDSETPAAETLGVIPLWIKIPCGIIGLCPIMFPGLIMFPFISVFVVACETIEAYDRWYRKKHNLLRWNQ